MNINLYSQNRKLSDRLLDSIALYLDDMSNNEFNYDQKQQSKSAALTLLDSTIDQLSDSLTQEAKEILIRIFQKTIFDLIRNDLDQIKKDSKVLLSLKNIF